MVTSEEIDRYFNELWNLLRSETIKVKIFKEYPLSAEGVRESQKDITGRGTVGKLLLCV
jgi:NADPH2:quinone reductase